jgi:pSer/pThr/pTyr-binding forkhead associated (FHA) protein
MGGMSANARANPPSEVEARAEAERAGRPFLLYRDGDDGQRMFVFEPGSATASVGRQPPSDLLLDWDVRVSRLHARFELVQDGWEVVDDGLSSNGTFVNEELVSGRRRLRDGDTLRFGSTTVTFRSPPHETPARADPGERPARADPGETPATVRLSTTQRRVLTALCRPCMTGSRSAEPATDEQIAEELFLSAAAVRTHLSVLCAKLGVAPRPGDEARSLLVQRAVSTGLIAQQDR